MKNTKLYILGVLALALALVEVYGQSPETDFEYEMADSKGVVITRYKGPGRNVIIPAEIEGFPVTEIRGGWLYDNETVTSVVIPDTVVRFTETTTNPRRGLFEGAKRLKEVTLPKGLTKIPARMFIGCVELASFTIPQGVTEIGEEAFAGCNFTAITIPDSVTKIGWRAFGACKNLTAITIPANVTEFGKFAFSYCTNLTAVTIPNGVTKIGYGAFDSCKNLTAITIPDSVTEIGEHAFSESGLQSVTIPDNVTMIGWGAFKGCYDLTTVTISPVKGRKWDTRGGYDTFARTKLNLRSQAALKAAGYSGSF